MKPKGMLHTAIHLTLAGGRLSVVSMDWLGTPFGLISTNEAEVLLAKDQSYNI